jgi:hypothetical protein
MSPSIRAKTMIGGFFVLPLIAAVDFMNFTYRTNPCQANVPVPAIVRKGAFHYLDQRAAVGFDIYVDAVKRGVLRDGTRQAVVVLTCEFPVGGTAAAYAFDERGDTAAPLGEVATANWMPDWGEGPSSIRVRFANRLLYVEHCKDDRCTKKVETTYALRRGKLVTIAVRPLTP